jgi:Ca2+-binding EF-hand superfamily protein
VTPRYGVALCAAALTAVALLAPLQADEPAKTERPALNDPGSLPEVQDVVFFTEKRPVLMRLRLYVDDKPGSVVWDNFQKKLFDYLDVDGDGFLDSDEVKRVPPAATVAQFFTGNPTLNGVPASVPIAELDTNKDGKVSPEELAAYYRRNGAGPYAAVTGAGRGNATDQLTNALFAALDVNKDGKLSKEKVARADKVLMKFDDNDDEMITPQELLGVARDPFAPQPQPRPGVLPPGRGAATNILLIPKDDGRSRLAQLRQFAKDVLAKYDKDKNGKLSREEIGFPKEMFDALKRDDNRDDQLSADELLPWVAAGRRMPPDLEVTVRLGRVDDKVKLIEAANDGKGRGGLQLHQTSPATLATALESSEVSVVRGNVMRADARFAQAQLGFFRQLFKQLDTQEKGFVTPKQVEGPQFIQLRSIFSLADRDGDEKLTEKELQAYMDLVTAAAGSQLALTFSDNGQGLFDLLDTNHDGRLSIREMRNAWNRLAVHDREGTGFITKSQIPRQYELQVGGTPLQNGRLPAMQPGGMTRPVSAPAPQRGPLWFHKMDINGDGDVSEREWLGSMEDFRKIDTDGDGLISVEEAIKADEWYRQKLGQK